jgi:hypothetical protein
MKIRRVVLLLASVALGALLIWILIRLGKVDLAATWRQLERVSAVDFAKLVALNVLLVGLSTLKWRSTDAALRRDSDAIPSRIAAFSMSSVGMALGLILPVQLGMTAARTAGTHSYGRTLKRGTGGTLFEQSFDFLTVMLFAAASAITWLCHGGAELWLVCGAVMVSLVLAAAGPLLGLFRKTVIYASKGAAHKLDWWLSGRPGHFLTGLLQKLSEIQHSGLLNAGFTRRLLIISVARFGVVVLMACQTAAMTGARIAFWQIAAATPFAAISNLIAITPGALGVNELTSVTALHLFGVRFSAASQWALTNRVLGTASCALVAISGLAVLGIERGLTSDTMRLRRTEKESILGPSAREKDLL